MAAIRHTSRKHTAQAICLLRPEACHAGEDC